MAEETRARGTGTGNDRTKGGTYWRDSESSLDYGVNRYYSSVTGRFMTVDPHGGSAVAGNPQSWNRYGYGLGDPVNGNDPTGLDDAADVSDWFSNFLSGLGVGGAGGSTDGYGATTPYDVGAVFNAIGSATAPSDGPTTYDVGAVFTATGTATNADSDSSSNSSPTTVSSGGVGRTTVSSGGVGPSDQWPFNGNLIPGTYPQDGVCTTGPLSGPMNSNPLVLACCQAHDKCYAQHQCNASSWLPVNPGSCTVCNIKAVACIKQAVLPVVPLIP